MNLVQHSLHWKIFIKGAIEKKLTREDFSNWNKKRQINFEKRVFKHFKNLNP